MGIIRTHLNAPHNFGTSLQYQHGGHLIPLAKVRRIFGVCKFICNILIKIRVPLFPCGMKGTKNFWSVQIFLQHFNKMRALAYCLLAADSICRNLKDLLPQTAPHSNTFTHNNESFFLSGNLRTHLSYYLPIFQMFEKSAFVL